MNAVKACNYEWMGSYGSAFALFKIGHRINNLFDFLMESNVVYVKARADTANKLRMESRLRQHRRKETRTEEDGRTDDAKIAGKVNAKTSAARHYLSSEANRLVDQYTNILIGLAKKLRPHVGKDMKLEQILVATEASLRGLLN